jgi:S1-C subfamily serine protease
MAAAGNWQSFSNELARVSEEAGKSVVAIHGGHRHSGSGVLWRDNIVITADHLIREDDDVPVTLSSEKNTKATVVGRDAATDLAALKLGETGDLKPANFGGASDLKIGNYVLALGRSRRGNIVASAGIISGLMGGWRTWQGSEIEQFIRPDLTLYPGFSGGPLIDSRGQVIGINTLGLRRSTPICIPHTAIARVCEELATRGSVARPYLGIAVRPVQLSDRTREELGLGTPYGVLIIQIEPMGPADQSGMLIGDVLVRAGGESIADSEDLLDLFSKKRIGDELEAYVVRGGKLVTLRIKLDAK